MRPLGGIIVGAWADRFGRKPAMVFTIALMSLGTLMIGIAPTYETAGYWGTATLVLARLIQGVAAGGEVGASMSLLVESSSGKSSRLLQQLVTGDLLAGNDLRWGCCFRSERMATVRHRFRNRNGRMGLACAVFIGVLLAPIGCWLRLSLENDVPEPVRNKKLLPAKARFSAPAT